VQLKLPETRPPDGENCGARRRQDESFQYDFRGFCRILALKLVLPDTVRAPSCALGRQTHVEAKQRRMAPDNAPRAYFFDTTRSSATDIDVCRVVGALKMLINRITSYLEDETETPQSGSGPSACNTANAPPANFAPVPTGLLGSLPQQPVSWQEELYRMAYEAAKAAVAAAALAANRARWN
jgi:hypothetical protein